MDSVRIIFTVDRWTRDELRLVTENVGMGMSEFIRRAVREKLDTMDRLGRPQKKGKGKRK